MLVRHRMTPKPITITPETPVAEALSFMRQNQVRRLPIVNKHGKMIGIVAEKDLLYASPSPATSLSVYEVGYLLAKLKVREIMTKDPITVDADAPLEEAARIMIDRQVSGLPVMEGEELVGIITETDIFKTVLEMLGAREEGIRLTLRVKNEKGAFAKIAGSLAAVGADIITLGTFYGEDRSTGLVILKIRGVDETTARRAMKDIEVQIEDLR
ncbi:MAG: CBS domain-containing protein [Anaerolineae bacterium]